MLKQVLIDLFIPNLNMLKKLDLEKDAGIFTLICTYNHVIILCFGIYLNIDVCSHNKIENFKFL